ncbi:MAG: GNAT family N-acetyltransferase [Rhizobiaceae bacterium]
MVLGRIFSRQGGYMIEPLGPDDAVTVARLHGDGFGRPWDESEFAALLEQKTVFGFAARQEGRGSARPDGFVLARLAAGEAEILTIAVARPKRGRGLGRALMEAVLRHLHAERAEALFLEVGENNQPAIALYRRLGFREVARRAAYYGGEGTAIVMRRDLGRTAP